MSSPTSLPGIDKLEPCDYMVATSDDLASFETTEDAIYLAKPRQVKSIATASTQNLYDTLKLYYLQQLATTNTLTPCSMATEDLLYHRLSSGTSIVAHRGNDTRVESRNPDDSRFKQPVLTINALHTPLYETAIRDGIGTA